MEQIFNREALRPGLWVSRRATAPISMGIVLATGIRTAPLWKLPFMGYGDYVATIIGLSHDAMFVVDPKDGVLKIGDAIGGKTGECVLTPIEEWERGCLEGGDRVIVGRPAHASDAQLAAAAEYWAAHILGKSYDHVAIGQLLLKAALGDWISYRVGLYQDFYCTEGVGEASAKGANLYPFWPNQNPTPGTTTRRYRDRRLVLEPGALTDEGMRRFALPELFPELFSATA